MFLENIPLVVLPLIYETFQCMIIGITCGLFFALAIGYLSMYVQFAGGIALSDYCNNPEAARDNFIVMPG